jgi:hypothetical protein
MPQARPLPLEIPAKLSPPELDRRRLPRGKCNHSGWILTEDEVFCECTVVDMTSLGVRIRVKEDDRVPENFLIMTAEFILRGQLRWRKGRFAGVSVKPFA